MESAIITGNKEACVLNSLIKLKFGKTSGPSNLTEAGEHFKESCTSSFFLLCLGSFGVCC